MSIIKKALLAATISVTGLIAASSANAALYMFVVTDPSATQGNVALDNHQYTFYLDSSPTPASYDSGSFTVDGTTTYGAGYQGNYSVISEFTFWTDDQGGGLQTPFNIYFSDQLFTGTTDAPTFTLGTFALTDPDGSITISEVAPPSVPESATWAMMVMGFGLIGGVMRARSTRVRFA